MKRVAMWVLIPALVMLVAGMGWHGSAMAQTTGKLTGRVTDAGSGSPLPGVNVVVEGTRRGGTTDADGYYLILSLEPGSYTLVSSMVGYATATKSDVRIQSGFTTTVNFQLTETTLQAQELVVVAERPPVEPDKTTSHYVMSAQQIEALPMARSVTDLVALNPGVNLTNASVIRGGDVQDGALLVDGIVIPNADGYGRQFSGPSKTAVQEVTVISGGANAEFGNLQSGVVSIVTKDGGRDYRGWTDFRYTPPSKKHWGENIYSSPWHKGKVKWSDREWKSETVQIGPGDDGIPGTPDDITALAHREVPYTDVKGTYIEGGASGPIGDQASFFASARWAKQPVDVLNTSAATSNTNPSLGATSIASIRSAGFGSLKTPLDIRGNAKFTFRPSSNLKASLGAIISRAEGLRGQTNVVRDVTSNGQNIFLPDGSGTGKFRITDNMYYATLTHTISPKTFHEFRFAYYVSEEDTLDTDYTYDAYGFPKMSAGSKDLDGWFNVAPQKVVDVRKGEWNRINAKYDLSSQVTKGHFVKAGFDLTRYSIYYLLYQETNTARARWVEFINHSGHLPDDKVPIKPYSLGFYVQDKMEFEGMVLNVGLRYDAFYTNHNFYNVSQLQSPQWRWLIKHVEMPTIDAQWATQLSPRFGISHPITERSAFHFTAGLYTKVPDFLNYFREAWRANGGDDHVAWDQFRGSKGQDRMANPYIAPEKTRAYEAGADWNFVSDYTAGISAYYKSAIGKVSSGSRYWFEPQGYTYVWGLKPVLIQDMKGFEASVRKAFSHYFSFNAAINFGWASQSTIGSNATMFFPDSTYAMNSDQYYDWKWDAASGQYVKLDWSVADRIKWGKNATANFNPNVGYMLGMLKTYEAVGFEFMDIQKAYNAPANMNGIWQSAYGGAELYNPKGSDLRTQSTLSLYFDSPADFGPGLRGFHMVGDLRANMVWHIQSGSPVWYTPPGQSQELRHKPIRTWTDLQVEKTLVQRGYRNVVAYAEVFNMFNQQDSAVPYNYPDYVRWGLNLPRPDDANFVTYGDYNELFRYQGTPRQWGLGLKVNF